MPPFSSKLFAKRVTCFPFIATFPPGTPLSPCFPASSPRYLVPRYQTAPAPRAPRIHRAGLLPALLLPALLLPFFLCGMDTGPHGPWGAWPPVPGLIKRSRAWTPALGKRTQQRGAFQGLGLRLDDSPLPTSILSLRWGVCQVLQGIRRHEGDRPVLVTAGIEPQG